MDDYKEIKELLRPRRDIRASDDLRHMVQKVLNNNRRNRIVKKWLFGGISLSAVAAAMLLVFIPSGMSAKEIISQTIEAMCNAENIEMVVDVRTLPVENFRHIDINKDFVTHHINIAYSDSLLRWRIDKGGRVAINKGKDIYTWIPSVKLGWHIGDSEDENIVGYMANLLTPRKCLEIELENCINNNSAEYNVAKSGSDIILVVHAAPQGNFDNPYLLNSSITESENIRRYVIDAESKRLKSATVSVVSGNREITVLKIKSINYGHPDNDICRLADGIRFIETEQQPDGLKCLDVEEAASSVLNAFENWDETILDKVIVREVSDATYREQFRGARLVSIGRSFTSGTGSSVFVPYTLELRDGTLRRHNLALQKTETGGWIVVGGL